MLQDGEEHDKTSRFRVCGPLSYFSRFEVNLLVGSNTVRNTVTVDKTFFKSTYVGFGRSIMCRKVKYITRLSIYSSKNKTLSFPRRK